MSRCALGVILGLKLFALVVLAQTVRETQLMPVPGSRFLKVVNGQAVFVQDIPGRKAQIVHIFDSRGRMVSLDVLSQIEGATDLSIYDVSAGSSGLIAVSAVTVTGEPSTVTSGSMRSLLFLYGGDGKLLNALKLDTHLDSVAVDDDGSVWGVGDSAGSGDPSAVPLFYRFTNDGDPVGFFPRSSFPGLVRHTANVVRTATTFAVLSFGVTNTHVWAWFPATQELVQFEKTGENLKRTYTGLPTSPDPTLDQIRMGSMGLTKTGELVSLVGFAAKTSHQRRAFLYKWRSGSGWEQVSHSGTERMEKLLVGLDGDQFVFRNTGAASFTLSWEKEWSSR